MYSLDIRFPINSGVAHLVIHGSSGSTSYETIPHVRLETSGGVLSTVNMVVQRHDGRRRLRDDDDDDDDEQWRQKPKQGRMTHGPYWGYEHAQR